MILGSLLWRLPQTGEAADFVTGFVRQEGTYTLNETGNHLRIYSAKDGQATYEFKWINPGGFETDSRPEKGFFAGKGWFAFIESPTRIWLYDGKRHLNIVHRKEKGVSIYSVAAKDYFNTCPVEVWAALPEAVRERLQQAGYAVIKP